MSVYNSQLIAAHNMVDRGWSIIPLHGKRPFKGSKGSKGGINDHQEVDHKFKPYPWANIGILTGIEYGQFVVDIDIKSGVDGFNSLSEHFGDRFEFYSDAMLITQTPNGGYHFYFNTNGRDVRNAQSVLPGIDIRGSGGFVVAPPSFIKIDGQRQYYQWNDKTLGPADPFPWVDELLDMAKLKKTSVSIPSQMRISESITNFDIPVLSKGERDSGIFKFASQCRARNIEINLAYELIEAAASASNPPFDLATAKMKVDYCYSHYPAGYNF